MQEGEEGESIEAVGEGEGGERGVGDWEGVGMVWVLKDILLGRGVGGGWLGWVWFLAGLGLGVGDEGNSLGEVRGVDRDNFLRYWHLDHCC